MSICHCTAMDPYVSEINKWFIDWLIDLITTACACALIISYTLFMHFLVSTQFNILINIYITCYRCFCNVCCEWCNSSDDVVAKWWSDLDGRATAMLGLRCNWFGNAHRSVFGWFKICPYVQTSKNLHLDAIIYCKCRLFQRQSVRKRPEKSSDEWSFVALTKLNCRLLIAVTLTILLIDTIGLHHTFRHFASNKPIKQIANRGYMHRTAVKG